ncbi:hypothetical protein [Pseudomonas xanthosomatis]|uniref:hypothetical protein n=1 Tax=Pseudomonas xanthosomatis TaxID=2842356 RepID=UPI00351875CC
MPPRHHRLPITTAYDQRYWCHPCELTHLDRDTDLDAITWTCKRCGHPVLVDLDDFKGNAITVERVSARAIRRDDYVILEHNLQLCLVLKSEKSGAGRWYLALQGHRGAPVDANRYYNRIPR